MSNRPKQGALSHDDVRSMLWRHLDMAYLTEDCDPQMWPWLLDVHDGFCVAKARVDGNYGLWKIPYTVSADGVELGTPGLIADKEASKVEGSLHLVASIGDQDEAEKMLAELEDKNPLFASLKNTPNAHFVVFDLTTIGKASQHSGKWKYRLSKAGLKAAMPTLIGKPVHVTSALDGHFDDGEAAKPVGVFMGSTEVDNGDGTSTLRAIANLWEGDFPDLVETLATHKDDLGASYEIFYPASAAKANGNVVEITQYQFSGGAILKRTAAAHPETKLHVANTDPVADPQPTPRPARIPYPIPVTAGGTLMPPTAKYAGIPVESESAVDAILAQFALETVEPLKAENLVLKADKDKLDTKIVELTTSKNDLQAQLTAKTDECTAAQEAYVKAQGTLDEQVFKAACTEKMKFVCAKYGLSDKQAQETRRIEIVEKIVAGKDPVSVEEFDTLISGGTGRKLVLPQPVPLMAGREPEGPTKDDIAAMYPGATKTAYR